MHCYWEFLKWEWLRDRSDVFGWPSHINFTCCLHCWVHYGRMEHHTLKTSKWIFKQSISFHLLSLQTSKSVRIMSELYPFVKNTLSKFTIYLWMKGYQRKGEVSLDVCLVESSNLLCCKVWMFKNVSFLHECLCHSWMYDCIRTKTSDEPILVPCLYQPVTLRTWLTLKCRPM